jgi:Rod binding domain-containing protein
MTKVPSHTTPYARPDDDETTTAARGLESHFLKQLMSEVQNSADGGMLDGGFAGSTFREMLNGALADNMAKAGGIGLTAMLTKEMARGTHSDAKTSAPVAGASTHSADAASAIQQLRV